jgi:BA14K-like protein
MRRYLTLACSGLLTIGTLTGFTALAMADSVSIPDIAPTVDAAGQAFRTLPAQDPTDGSLLNPTCTTASCGQSGLQSAVLLRKPGDANAGLQLVRGGRGGGFIRHGGGGFHGFGGGGAIHAFGGGGGFHGMGGGNFSGWRGGWHGIGGPVWRGNAWRGGWRGIGGPGWRGNYWRGGWHGIGTGWRGNVWRSNWWGGGWGGDGWDWGDSAFFGFGVPLLTDYGYYDYPYYNYVATPVANSHVAWCFSRYRTYRAADNTFQPAFGPRRQCISPF